MRAKDEEVNVTVYLIIHLSPTRPGMYQGWGISQGQGGEGWLIILRVMRE